MTAPVSLPDTILDTALALADRQPWEKIRLQDIARTLGISLDEIRLHYAQKDDLIDAWFDRADQAMLRQAAGSDLSRLPPEEQLEEVMMSWMASLAPHRRATRGMIMGQLEPGHLHVQWAGVLRISRTVQWMREAAHRDASYLNRALEETLLTGIYLLTFARWLTDESEGSWHTRRQLRTLLRRARLMLRLTGESGAQGRRHRPQRPRPSLNR